LIQREALIQRECHGFAAILSITLMNSN
jgi:hypothetical protein